MPAPKKPAKTKKAKKADAAAPRLMPPPDGVVVRMYRIGHGDCFLLALAGKAADKPAYVLIDCGYKPGSPKFINTTAKEITDNIRDATGGHIDVAIITHEHQDHVNAISEANFKGITIGESWFAWTEDPADGIANDLRKKFKDKLLGLLAARNRLNASGDVEQVRRIDRFLAFEFGGEDEAFNAAAAAALLGAAANDSAGSLNKKSMKLFKDRASKGVRFIRPHEKILEIPGAKDLRVFALGPPRDPEQLKSLDPVGEEGFHSLATASGSVGSYFASAAQASQAGAPPEAPFASRYCVAWEEARAAGTDYGGFFSAHYGWDGQPPVPGPLWPMPYETPSNAPWRRIDKDWLFSAEQLALDMNDLTNNSSLVLAFEMGKGGKILLFAADAQRGNWISWAKKEWQEGEKKVTARELLGRTVLYKVGHHGSHNATLHGQATDVYPNLGWMAEGDHNREFTAMITAVRAWAETQDGWDHPLKAIKDALLKKASGRVFQTDTDFGKMKLAEGGSAVDWKAFEKRATGRDRLYFDYEVRR